MTLSADPYGPAGTTAIAGLRQRLAQDAPGALVGGSPAIAYDATQTAGRDDAIIVPLVLVVILVVVGLLLQAVIAPLVLVLTTALSFAASFGLSSLLWHALGYAGVQSTLPIYIFIFLVALGVDYNIFLSARIREESRRLGLRGGTLRGLGVTGGVITAAGVVLAATFAALTQIPRGQHRRGRHRGRARRAARHAGRADRARPRQPARHRRARLVAYSASVTRARQVSMPTTPSDARPADSWKARVKSWVVGPKMPSAAIA